MLTPLVDVLDRRLLRDLAGGRSFERGEAYVADGRVRLTEVGAEEITASVQGANRYRVELRAAPDHAEAPLAFDCTCPIGLSGEFCKHCVAVGLAALGEGLTAPSNRRGPRGVLDHVRSHLSRLEREELVELVVEEARRNHELLERLRLRAASDEGSVDLATFREAIERAVDRGGYIDYGAAYDYADEVHRAISSIEEVLGRDHPDAVVELTEYFLSAIEEIGGMIDDSDGHLHVIVDRLERLHHSACLGAEPDPEALAERLLERALGSDLELFLDAAETYADILGEPGGARYAELARAKWEQIPELEPGDESDYGGARFAITHIMELLARRAGDVDELVAVKRRDLSSPYSFLEIAKALEEGGRFDDAREWAERGLQAFAGEGDPRLTELLARAYSRAGRHHEALEFMWDEFAQRPGLDAYRKVKEYAEPAESWPKRRERALGLLRKRASETEDEPPARGYAWMRADRSQLVRIFLWEGDLEAAWQEAEAGGCSDDLWLELAERRKDSHPDDALAVYRAQVDAAVALTSKQGYREAVRLIGEIRNLLTSLNRNDEAAAFIQGLREAHRRKRSFVRMLDEVDSQNRDPSASGRPVAQGTD